MSSIKWQTKLIVLKANEVPQISMPAQMPVRYVESSFAKYVGIVILIFLAATSLVFPVILLLNIPILIFRSFLKHLIALKEQKIRLQDFTCPLCKATNSARELSERLPFTIKCDHCSGPIILDQSFESLAGEKA
jgi:hypothetical protein